MEDTNEEELLRAIKVFKVRYGILKPLDMFELDNIIRELRTEAKTKVKRKGRKRNGK